MKKVFLTAVAIAVIIIVSSFLFNNFYYKRSSSLRNQQNNEQLSQLDNVLPTRDRRRPEEIKQPKTQEEPSATENTNNEPNKVKHEIIYTDSGYSPSMLTIKVGETVTFINNSSFGVWTASAIHPAHIVYGGVSLQEHCPDVENDDFDQCKSSFPGESWDFTFNKKGTWGYHNHVKASDFGKIVVDSSP